MEQVFCPSLHLFSNSLSFHNFLRSLITKIEEESLQFGTYQKLIKLLDNYNPDVTVEETPTSEELQEEQEFLDEMFQLQSSAFNRLILCRYKIERYNGILKIEGTLKLLKGIVETQFDNGTAMQ